MSHRLSPCNFTDADMGNLKSICYTHSDTRPACDYNDRFWRCRPWRSLRLRFEPSHPRRTDLDPGWCSRRVEGRQKVTSRRNRP